jgi:hypothetical protein
MVGHQAERMQRTAVLAAEIEKVREIDQAIAVQEEAILAVVAPMPDVDRDIGNDEARLSRHTARTSRMFSSLTRNKALTPI